MPLSVESKTQSYTMENIPLYIFDARTVLLFYFIIILLFFRVQKKVLIK